MPEDPITFAGRLVKFAPLALTSLGLFILVSAVTGAYRRKLTGTWHDFVSTSRAVGFTTLFIVFATFVGKTSQMFSRLTILLFWISGKSADRPATCPGPGVGPRVGRGGVAILHSGNLPVRGLRAGAGRRAVRRGIAR